MRTHDAAARAIFAWLFALSALAPAAPKKHKGGAGGDAAGATTSQQPGDAGSTTPASTPPASAPSATPEAPASAPSDATASPSESPLPSTGASPGTGETAETPSSGVPPSEPPSGEPSSANRKERSGRPPSAEPEEDTDEAEKPEIRHARDTLGSHLIIGANAGLFLPFGSFDQTTDQSDLLGAGLSVGGDVGFGVSHTVVVGAYGDFGMPKGENCSSCSGSSFAVGPFVRYHLVQGIPFDPWLSAGAGFRKASVGSSSWTGVDVVRLALGGDYYPWPSFGFGPFSELTLGTFFDGSPKLATHSVNANFTLGMRVVFDSPGK